VYVRLGYVRLAVDTGKFNKNIGITNKSMGRLVLLLLLLLLLNRIGG
jgi:hypothetical protein